MLLQFRTSRSPQNACRHIIEHSPILEAQFQARASPFPADSLSRHCLTCRLCEGQTLTYLHDYLSQWIRQVVILQELDVHDQSYDQICEHWLGALAEDLTFDQHSAHPQKDTRLPPGVQSRHHGNHEGNFLPAALAFFFFFLVERMLVV